MTVVAESAPAFELRGLTKTFGGTPVLQDVDLVVRAGEVHGLLGENGSGKSTLIKILAGFHDPDRGTLRVNGRDIPLPLSPGQFRELGIEFVHQDLGLIPSLTVLENLLLGELIERPALKPINWKGETRRARAVLDQYGVRLDPLRKVEDLEPVEQALLAIVRGIEGIRKSLDSRGDGSGLLCLDEPTAFLPRDEADRLFALVRRVTQQGASVVFVSHDLDEVCREADRVTVLRNGINVGTVSPEVGPARLAELIVGRDVVEPPRPDTNGYAAADIVLSVQGLRVSAVQGISFEVARGEVVGITGLVGSGFDEVPYALFGARDAQAESFHIDGEPVQMRGWNPTMARARGLSLVPGNRARDGSIGTMSMQDNIMQLSTPRYTKLGVIARGAIARAAVGLLEKYDVRPRDPHLEYGSFSGGNQQKALMAKWLEEKPQAVLLHEPTQGVDIGARHLIFELIHNAAQGGAAVMCASSDYEQLAAISSRVLVVAEGRIVAELRGADVTKAAITDACLLSASVDADSERN